MITCHLITLESKHFMSVLWSLELANGCNSVVTQYHQIDPVCHSKIGKLWHPCHQTCNNLRPPIRGAPSTTERDPSGSHNIFKRLVKLNDWMTKYSHTWDAKERKKLEKQSDFYIGNEFVSRLNKDAKIQMILYSLPAFTTVSAPYNSSIATSHTVTESGLPTLKIDKLYWRPPRSSFDPTGLLPLSPSSVVFAWHTVNQHFESPSLVFIHVIGGSNYFDKIYAGRVCILSSYHASCDLIIIRERNTYSSCPEPTMIYTLLHDRT